MRKIAYELGEEITADTPRRPRRAKILLILLLVAWLVPLGLDGMSICVGLWKASLGMPSEVSTPTLDRVAEVLHDADRAVRASIAPWFYSLPWKPDIVIPAAMIVMVVAMLLLRR